MTASSTRCCRSISCLAALVVLGWGTAFTAPARADGIEVRQAALISAEDGYVLEADFEVTLTHTLQEALNKGVPLYFTLEFELVRPRWYWLNESLANARQEYRLSYNALTRQYRVGLRTLYQNFASLREALEFLSRVRVREIAETDALNKGSSYRAALRLRLDSAQLPRPFRVSAVGSREWTISSDWHRWTVSP
jgi:hypothetical protein